MIEHICARSSADFGDRTRSVPSHIQEVLLHVLPSCTVVVHPRARVSYHYHTRTNTRKDSAFKPLSDSEYGMICTRTDATEEYPRNSQPHILPRLLLTIVLITSKCYFPYVLVQGTYLFENEQSTSTKDRSGIDRNHGQIGHSLSDTIFAETPELSMASTTCDLSCSLAHRYCCPPPPISALARYQEYWFYPL